MRPMKPETVTTNNIHQIRLPVYGSPKLDGFRAFKHMGVLMSSGFQPIRNRAVQALFKDVPDGYDGELVQGAVNDFGRSFFRTSKIVTAFDPPADGVKFYVFDNYAHTGRYLDRLLSVDDTYRLTHHRLDTVEQILSYAAQYEQEGYEGLIMRNPDGVYKFGRSTMTDQGMLRIKPFADYEGTVVGVEEMYRNKNEAKIDAQGYVDRGTKKEGMVPAGCMGTMLVEFDGQVLRVSQGFTQEMREEYGASPPRGELCKCKGPPGGKPRSEGGTGLRPPYVFLGLRDRSDI